MSKIKVLIVDDSALVRKMLTEIIDSDPGIEVIGTAADPIIARDKIKQLKPDVLTLDVEMPRMDGVSFLKNLMRLRPMPVIMVSTLTEKGADITLDAIEMGAIDFVTKPKIDFSNSINDYAVELVQKIKVAASSKVSTLDPRKLKKKVTLEELPETESRNSADAVIKKSTTHRHFKTTDKLLAIGASTGGTEAIKVVLKDLPANTPGTVITQHIPAAFSGTFAQRLDAMCQMTVKEAEDGEQILPGHVYIAPGSHHLLVERNGAQFICRLNDGPLVNRHKPSVDVLFRSVADNIGSNAVGIILTGMGNDGAAGMKEMQDVGSPTIAQDEKTSVVWGMPGEAVKLGAADQVMALDKIASNAIDQLEKV